MPRIEQTRHLLASKAFRAVKEQENGGPTQQKERKMQITINGKRESMQSCSLSDLVKAKGLNSDALVIELNHKIIKREHWEQIQLKNNDNLELLSFVGGG